MTTLYDEFGARGYESSILEEPSSRPGIGLSPEQAPAPVETRVPKQTTLGVREEMLAQMSPSERFFGMLGDVGRGLQGKPGRLDSLVEEKRKEKLLRMQELQGSVSALEHGVKMVEGLQGERRTAFVDNYAARLDDFQPGLGTTYRALSDRPHLLTEFQAYAPYMSEPMRVMMKANPKGFLKFATETAEGVRALESARERSLLEGTTGAASKVLTIMGGLQQLAPPEMVEKFTKDKRFTVAELRELNEWLTAQKSPAALSAEQLRAAEKAGDEFWTPFGILSPRREAAVMEASAKDTKGMKPGTLTDIPLGGKNFAKAAYDPDGTLFPGAEHDANGFAILGKGTKEGMKLEFPATASEVTRDVDGKPHKIKIQISPDGTVRETDMGEIAPAPKESNPSKDLIRATLAAGKSKSAPKAEPKAASATDVAKKFNADASMKGNRLGKETPQGFEVFDAKGQLIGHYKR